MRFTANLLPLLLASQLPAHVISVFAAGKEGELCLDDLSLRDPNHSGLLWTRSHVTHMHTFFFESLAAQHPGKLSLVHVFPGLVMTDAFNNPGVPRWFKILWYLFNPIIRLFSTPLDECGERILFLASPLRFPARQTTEGGNISKAEDVSAPGSKVTVARGTDSNLGSGAYAVTIDGETCKNEQILKKYRGGEASEKICAHTLQAFEDISAGKVFTG